THILDLKTGNRLGELAGFYTDSCRRAVFDGRFFSASPEGIKVWDLETQKFSKTFSTLPVDSLVISEGKLYSGSNGQIDVWDLGEDKLLRTFNLNYNGVPELAIFDGKFYAGSNDIEIWDLKTVEHLTTLEGHQLPITFLLISGGKLYSSSKDKTI